MRFKKFKEFLNEQNLEDRSLKDYDDNDWGYYLMKNKIEKHLDLPDENILELEYLPDFEEGEISTYSTSTKGNFVLNCGSYSKGPACKVIDELNDVILYYIPLINSEIEEDLQQLGDGVMDPNSNNSNSQLNRDSNRIVNTGTLSPKSIDINPLTNYGSDSTDSASGGSHPIYVD